MTAAHTPEVARYLPYQSPCGCVLEPEDDHYLIYRCSLHASAPTLLAERDRLRSVVLSVASLPCDPIAASLSGRAGDTCLDADPQGGTLPRCLPCAARAALAEGRRTD